MQERPAAHPLGLDSQGALRPRARLLSRLVSGRDSGLRTGDPTAVEVVREVSEMRV